MAEEPSLLTTAEAAEVLGVTPDRVTFYVRQGSLPAIRVRTHWAYQFRRTDLDAFLLAHRHEPGSWPSFRRKPDGREWLALLTAAGWSDERICAETGMSAKALARSRQQGVGNSYRRRLRELVNSLEPSGQTASNPGSTLHGGNHL